MNNDLDLFYDHTEPALEGNGGNGDILSEMAIGSEMNLPHNKWRAKLYQLNTSGCWDDYGTGDFQIIKDVSIKYLL